MKDLLYKIDRDRFRKKLLKYTCQAFNSLPEINNPAILDIGCSTGVPALELAKLSDGTITGIDVDEKSIDIFKEKIKKRKLNDRVKAVRMSMLDMDFPKEAFDIVWFEGTIFVIGFEKGLLEWKKFLNKSGFIVIHDEFKDHDKKLSLIYKNGFDLLDCFMISSDVWGNEYYKPFENHIKKLFVRYKNDSEANKMLAKEQNEIDTFKKNPENNNSIFYITQHTYPD